MFATFILGLLLGWGAAIPIGPINLEIMRRNLTYGWSAGVTLGLGACAADLCYLLVLALGLLSILHYPLVLAALGMVGSLIIAWFAYGAFRLNTVTVRDQNTPKQAPWRSFLGGLVMTLINPFTVLFWGSVSAQIASLSSHSHELLWAASGVILGTVSWIFAFNSILHMTRHKITLRVRRVLNIIAGLVLLGFALHGFIHGLEQFILV